MNDKCMPMHNVLYIKNAVFIRHDRSIFCFITFFATQIPHNHKNKKNKKKNDGSMPSSRSVPREDMYEVIVKN